MKNEAVINGFTPVAAGVTKAPTAALMDRARINRLKLSQAANLSDFADQYAFYHPGMMYCLVNFGQKEVGGVTHRVDPFVSFTIECSYPDVVPASFSIERPVLGDFSILGHAGWNHVVYALEKPIFEHYKTWIGSVGVMDYDQGGNMLRIRPQTFNVVDPLAMDKSIMLRLDLPRIELTVFGVETSRTGSYYAQEFNALSPLMIKHNPHVDQATIRLAENIRNESPEPYADIPLGEDDVRADVRGAGEGRSYKCG